MGTNVAQQRSEGFNSVIAENPDMEIVACQVADFDRAKSNECYGKHPAGTTLRLTDLYAANDEMLIRCIWRLWMPQAGLLISLRLAVMPSMIHLEAIKDSNVWKQPSQSRRSSLGKAILEHCL